MLSSNTEGGSVRSSENHWAFASTSGHVKSLGSTVDDLIDGLHGEVEGHEFANGLHSSATEGSSDGHTGETHLGNWSVDDSVFSVLEQESIVAENKRSYLAKETSRNLIGTIILGDFLADQNDAFISFHFLVHRHVERISHEHYQNRRKD